MPIGFLDCSNEFIEQPGTLARLTRNLGVRVVGKEQRVLETVRLSIEGDRIEAGRMYEAWFTHDPVTGEITDSLGPLE